jgi:hypothetical protein
MEINKFQLKRVNPFQGLVIDADTWQDAHSYHRDQQKLHVLAFHDTGIVSGLEVTAINPPDDSVNINAGMAIDPDGNVILVPQKQRYKLKTLNVKGAIYLIIQFREIPGEPYQPPEGGQPTRILEAYRIQERDVLPSEPYVELARIDFDPAQSTIREAANGAKPGINEIDLRTRKNAKKTALESRAVGPAVVSPLSVPPAAKESGPKEALVIGHVTLGEVAHDLHLNGLRNLVKEYNRRADFTVVVEDQVNIGKTLKRYSLLYLTGNGRFELSAEQQSALRDYIKSGSIVIGDGCSSSSTVSDIKGAKEFGLSFIRWAGKLDCKLEVVKRGHQLLMGEYLFSEVPPGCEAAMLLEGGNMISNSSDYGCAWAGGYEDKPLARETIRSATEMGGNLISYALRSKSKSHAAG